VKQIFRSNLAIAGLILIVVGAGPLVVIMLAAALGFTQDPDPNPVLFGMSAMFSFWPGLLMIVVGVIRAGGRINDEGESDTG
jgi:Na+/melibiose symporter-like transporter